MWAFGCVVYEMATGVHAISSPTPPSALALTFACPYSDMLQRGARLKQTIKVRTCAQAEIVSLWADLALLRMQKFRIWKISLFSLRFMLQPLCNWKRRSADHENNEGPHTSAAAGHLRCHRPLRAHLPVACEYLLICNLIVSGAILSAE